MATPSNVPFPRLSVGRAVVVPATLLSVNVHRRLGLRSLARDGSAQQRFAALGANLVYSPPRRRSLHKTPSSAPPRGSPPAGSRAPWREGLTMPLAQPKRLPAFRVVEWRPAYAQVHGPPPASARGELMIWRGEDTASPRLVGTNESCLLSKPRPSAASSRPPCEAPM